MDQPSESPDILRAFQLIIEGGKESENAEDFSQSQTSLPIIPINSIPEETISLNLEETHLSVEEDNSSLSILDKGFIDVSQNTSHEDSSQWTDSDSGSIKRRRILLNDESDSSFIPQNQNEERDLRDTNEEENISRMDCSEDDCQVLKQEDEKSSIEINRLYNDQSKTSEDEDSGEDEFESRENIEPEKEEEIVEPLAYYWEYSIKSKANPICLATSDNEYKAGNFLKGCKWAPDGSCILSNSDDRFMRIYNLPSTFSNIQVSEDWEAFEENDNLWKPNIKVLESGLIYDYCWFPLMSSYDPVTACFFTTASDNPIHLWDAFTGTLRATYSPFNHLDNAVSAHSIAIDAIGDTIYTGFDKCLRIFKLSRPGRDCVVRTLKHSKLPDLSQNGIISTIAVHPTISNMIACGSFRGSIGIYGEESTKIISLLNGHKGGITQISFSNDGTKLFSGARKDSKLLCWDLRHTKEKYKTFLREVDTNQRVYFDLTPDDKYLISGNTNGSVKIWQTNEENEDFLCQFAASTNCLNGISINKFVPVMATSSGQRLYDDITSDSEEEIFTDTNKKRIEENKLKLWKLL